MKRLEAKRINKEFCIKVSDMVGITSEYQRQIKVLEEEKEYRKNEFKELKKELKSKKELLRYYQKKS